MLDQSQTIVIIANASVTSCCLSINAGVTFAYTILQQVLWWVLHTTALVWYLVFPLHARSFQTTHKIKYIHITCVLIGIIIPLVPVIATMADFRRQVQSDPLLLAINATFTSVGFGYVINRFPQLLCFGYNGDVVFYSNVLPIILLFYVGVTELILVFAIVYKVSWTITILRNCRISKADMGVACGSSISV